MATSESVVWPLSVCLSVCVCVCVCVSHVSYLANVDDVVELLYASAISLVI